MCMYEHVQTSYTWILQLLHNHSRLSGEVRKWMDPFVLVVSTCPGGIYQQTKHMQLLTCIQAMFNEHIYIY